MEPAAAAEVAPLDLRMTIVGNVVKLDPRRRRSRTALVLGGGGFTGGVYQIGALRALELLSVNRSVNEFDVYVGTSAGAFVAALTANGATPEEMMRVVNDDAPEAFPELGHGTILRPNYRELIGRAAALPLQALRTAAHLSRNLGSFTLVDLVVALGDALPSGLYSGAGIEEYMRAALPCDDFRELGRELYLVATDLDSCERIVFGAAGWDDVPISSAVRASTALPMVYKPHRIRDRELVDGGIVSTTNIDIAVEAGARFVVVINPLVPYVGGGRRRISEMGFPKIGYQTFKLLAYQRLHELARSWERRYPGVDIVLIEPEPDDELMFQTNVLSYASRAAVARHGFESVTVKLAREYDDLRDVCLRHGIEISAARLRQSA
jgi:predicted acylesterase/phospholipase RssA